MDASQFILKDVIWITGAIATVGGVFKHFYDIKSNRDAIRRINDRTIPKIYSDLETLESESRERRQELKYDTYGEIKRVDLEIEKFRATAEILAERFAELVSQHSIRMERIEKNQTDIMNIGNERFEKLRAMLNGIDRKVAVLDSKYCVQGDSEK